MRSQKIHVFILSDSYLLRTALKNIINDSFVNNTIYEFSCFDDINVFNEQLPDFIIFDLMSCELSEINISELRIKYNKSKFVRLDRFIAKSDNLYDIIISIISEKSEIIKSLKKAYPEKEKYSSELSARENEIIALVAKGLTNNEIAEQLFISSHTVITHRKNIVKKLGIKTVSGLTVYAVLNGLVNANDVI